MKNKLNKLRDWIDFEDRMYYFRKWFRHLWLIELIRNISNFCKNLFRFRKSLWTFRNWDFTHNLEIFKQSLILTAKCIEYGYEVDEDRIPKHKRMLKAIELLNNIVAHNYIDQAENILGKEMIYGKAFSNEITNNKEIYNLSDRLEEEQWKEVWNIIESDMRGWWD